MFDRQAAKEAFRAALSGVSRGDPYQLAKVIQIPPVAIQTSDAKGKGKQASETIKADNGTDWSAILNPWLEACEFSAHGSAVKSYDSQAELHAAFNQLFATSTGNILVPTMRAVCKSSHRLAVVADREADSRDNARLNNAATLLQESYSKTFNDRKEFRPEAPFDEDGSKKAGVLSIVNELFAIYFRLNTLRLCKNLAKPVEIKKLHLQGTMGQMVTYRYFSGRLCLFEDNFVDAERHLEYALSNCHRSAFNNKRSILRYLIPVKLYCGKLPTSALLKEYELDEFVLIVEGVRKGDLKTFNEALLKYQHRFIRQGTYLLLERCKTVCYRSLFKKMHTIVGKPYLPIGAIVNAFKWLDIPIDSDEVECIAANLIYRGIIRGYIAHTKGFLVLSKQNAFPADKLGNR